MAASADNFISARQYEGFQRLRSFERRAYRLEWLPKDLFEAIKAATMDTSHDHLNALLEDVDLRAGLIEQVFGVSEPVNSVAERGSLKQESHRRARSIHREHDERGQCADAVKPA